MASPYDAPSAGPPQPSYVLRGHAVPVHSLHFTRNNTRLLSGDAEGFVVCWSLVTKRAVASWQAHAGPILGLGSWGDDRIITHGRSESLCVWALTLGDEDGGVLSTLLPVECVSAARQAPWILHRLEISTLTFCSFASCSVQRCSVASASVSQQAPEERRAQDDSAPGSSLNPLLIAVCGSRDTQVEIYQLPDEKQVALVPETDQSQGKTGMVMALQLRYDAEDETLLLAAAYESGRACVFMQTPSQGKRWREIYSAQPHSQPVLSLSMAPASRFFFTSSADAIIARHPLLPHLDGDENQAQVNTHHAGQQGLKVRDDGKIMATAGWDARVRVYSVKTLKEVAVLKWHKEGCYAVAFADVHYRKSQERHVNSSKRVASQSISRSREKQVTETHWLAAGSKDGKITLWNVF
ncbi:MAG: ASTRA complex subunit [Chrysothrix sp. TS-e1954]|nr:MAG: ASTRA complex subunit [Chrysothrix sp. TS-e1954]